MTPSIDPVQFPRQIWQAVSDQARKCLLRRDFCPDQSRIENLRCVHLREETAHSYGQQIWFFEAIGVDPIGRRHMLFGALELSIEYAILEPRQTALFQDVGQRQTFLQKEAHEALPVVWQHASTKFWVQTTCVCMVVLAAIWVSWVIKYFAK